MLAGAHPATGSGLPCSKARRAQDQQCRMGVVSLDQAAEMKGCDSMDQAASLSQQGEGSGFLG